MFFHLLFSFTVSLALFTSCSVGTGTVGVLDGGNRRELSLEKEVVDSQLVETTSSWAARNLVGGPARALRDYSGNQTTDGARITTELSLLLSGLNLVSRMMANIVPGLKPFNGGLQH